MRSSDLRKQLRAQGLQNTQRSWDNYVGDKPVKSKVGSDFYGNSPKYGAGGTEVGNFGGNRTQRSSTLNSSKDAFGDFQSEESEYDKLQKNSLKKRFEEKARKSALERGMSELRKGRMVDDNFEEDFYVS